MTFLGWCGAVFLSALLVVTFIWHRHEVAMSRLEGQSLGLDQCRAMFIKKGQ